MLSIPSRRPTTKTGLNKKSVKKGSGFFFVYLLGTVTALCLAFLLAPPMQLPTETLAVGDISLADIKAPSDFSVEDQKSTIKRQNEAVEQVLSIYDSDKDILQALNKIDIFFTQKNKFPAPETEPPGTNGQGSAAERENRPTDKEPAKKELPLEERWRLLVGKDILPISLETFRILQNPLYDRVIQNTAKTLASKVLAKDIVGNKELLLTEKDKGILKRNIKNKSETILQDISAVWDVEEAKQAIQQQAPKILKADPLTLQAAVEIAQLTVTPNLFLNKSATEEAKQAVLHSVKPVYFQVKKGEMIVREGERVREDQIVKLNSLRIQKHKNTLPLFISGVFILLLLLFYFLLLYLKKFRPQIMKAHNNIYLLMVILAVTFTLSRFFIFLSNALSAYTPEINISAYSYAIPFALGGLLVAVLVDTQLGIIFSLVIGILASIQMGNNFAFFFPAAIGGMAAVFGLAQIKQRTALLKAGLIIGGANMGVILPSSLMSADLVTSKLVYDCIGGVFGGLLVVTIASAIIPLLETIFKVTTDIRLLELSDMNQPLLKQLALEAPGTYQHSIVVGSLAESAAEAIGANPLLARIASYYHDIGKTSKAEYFVENQSNSENKHSSLSPSMSNLIIINHVREGLELARQYKLPPLIMDVIRQHHGTSLIKYFYQKAKQQENSHLQVVREDDFSYAGPKPQTKESGIIMLADVLEATARSVSNPNPQKLEDLAHRVIHDIYNAGQLDECDLTLKNLSQIASAFARILTSVYHPRIAYPAMEKKERQEQSWTYTSETNKKAKKHEPLS